MKTILVDVDYFKERLGAKTITVESGCHIGGSDSIKEYPLIQDELLKLVERPRTTTV